MAGLLSLFFTWPAQCCGCRDGGPPKDLQEAQDKGQAPTPVGPAANDPALRRKHSAIWAVMRLIPEMKFREGTDFEAESCGGQTGGAHKVTLTDDPSRTYFVRVGRFSPQLRGQLKEAGERGIAVKVLGADMEAIIQELRSVSAFPIWSEVLKLPEEQRLAQAAEIGRFTAKMHKLPLPPGSTVEVFWKELWLDLPRRFMKFREENATRSVQLLKLLDYVSHRPMNTGVGGEAGGVVFTHGDWRTMSVLAAEGGGLLLCNAHDSQACACSRACDVAVFLWLWDFRDADYAVYADAIDTYPPLSARRALAEAYLSEAGFPADREAVDEFLWEVEYESLRMVLLWISLVGLRSDRCDWRRTIVFMETMLSTALSGNTALRDSIVEFGLMSGAQQRKFGEHFPEVESNSRIRSQI